MRLLDDSLEQKLSLDVTPLLDVVFILVLFFAVSTSFITPRELRGLKNTLSGLQQKRTELGNRIAEITATLQGKESELAALDSRYQGLQRQYEQTVAGKRAEVERLEKKVRAAQAETREAQWKIDALEKQRVSLARTLSRTNDLKQSLREQLDQAYKDFQSLNLRFQKLESKSSEQDARERLLQALIEKRARELAATKTDLAAAREKRAAREADVKTLQEKNRKLDTNEQLLQALLADRTKDKEALAGQVQDLEHTRAQQEQNVTALQARVVELENELAGYRKVAQLDRKQVQRILEAQQSLRAGLEEYLHDNRIGIERDQQRLTLKLSDQILFDSGSAEIKAGGLEVLRRVGEIVKERAGNLELQVGGHTDNVPVAAGGRYANNWELSAARAVNVVRFFEREVGIDPSRMSAVGYGSYRPVASNHTAEGRARNRRIEIVLLPR